MEKQPYSHQNFPSWRYGPNGAAQVFENESSVPAGWADHPDKVKGKTAPIAPPAASSSPAPGVAPANQGDGSAEVDAQGTPWNADLHAATKTKTSAGLWRMKVGVARPETKPLDL